MKNVNNAPKKKNISFKRFLTVFKEIKMPWVLIITVLLLNVYKTTVGIRSLWMDASRINEQGVVDMPWLKEFIWLTFVGLVFGLIITLLTSVITNQLSWRMKQKAWKKVMFLPQSFFDKYSPEVLLNRVTNDAAAASNFVSILITILMQGYTTAMFLKNMFTTDSAVAWKVLAMCLVGVVIGWIIGRMMYSIKKWTATAAANTTGYLVEHTKNLPMIKTSGTSAQEVERATKFFNQQFKQDMYLEGSNQFRLIVGDFLRLFCQYVPLFVLGALAMSGEIDSGSVITFYNMAGTVASFTMIFVMYWGDIKGFMGGVERILEIMDEEPEDATTGIELDTPNADITFQNVTFAYNEEKGDVLKNVSVTIPKGKITAVIGSNGSGKSTLLKLLERMYEPKSGNIYFGQDKVSKYSLNSWRKTFVTISQGSPVMEGTIRSNMTYGCDREVSDAELVSAAKQAGIFDLIQTLPAGFDTPVVLGGANFSGGQRQCIAIARVILSNPDYLLLDEATSNLDAKSERVVTDAMANLMQGRTTVMIAHNLSAIRHADNVIVLKDGKVEATGTPAEIIKTCTEYHDFVTSQTLVKA